VITEDVGVVALLNSCHSLLFLKLMDGGELIAQPGSGLELFRFGGGQHACVQGAFKLGMAAFKEELRIAHSIGVGFEGGEPLNTRSETAVNVVLQARPRMKAAEVDIAAGDKKAAVNEFDDAVGEISGEIRAVISGSIFAQSACDKDFWEAVAQRELDIGIGLIVAKKNVEAWMALLDEVVFQGQSFVLVGDQDVIEIDSFAHERAGFRIGL